MRSSGRWAGVLVSLAALTATPAVAQDPEPSVDFRAPTGSPGNRVR